MDGADQKVYRMKISALILGRICRYALIALVLICAVPPYAKAGGSTDELNRKIADITLLRDQLQDRKQQAEAALEAVLKQQNELVSEVHLLIKSLNIKSLEQARQYLRLRYDIELIGTIVSYRQAFENKIQYYQTGRDKLSYLQQLAEDDTGMVSTLSEFRIDALTTQISLIINQYLEEAHSIQITAQSLETIPAQKIWADITGTKD